MGIFGIASRRAEIVACFWLRGFLEMGGDWNRKKDGADVHYIEQINLFVYAKWGILILSRRVS